MTENTEFNRIEAAGRRWGQAILSWFFLPPVPAIPVSSQWGFRVLLFVLFFIGVGHWIFFFNAGQLGFTAHDWPKEISYLRVIRESVQNMRLPLYINQAFQGTDRFMALPETLMSPQALLLGFVVPEKFVLINILVLYSAGFIGLLVLHRRFRFSPVVFAVLFLLFNFNGYITSRMAAGHFMWSGYFLLPFFVHQILLGCEERQPGWRRAAATGLVLTGILYQGTFHLWVWCLMFLVFLGFGGGTQRNYAFRTLLISVLTGAFRLVPAAVCLAHRQNRFLSGYPTLGDFISAFVQRHSPLDSMRGGFFGKLGLGWWEFDIYVGLAAFAFLLYFGVFHRGWAGTMLRFKPLDVPLVLLAFLSIADTYALFAFSHLPFADAERVSARFIIVPFVFVLIFACARASVIMSQLSGAVKSIILLLAVITAQELMQHSYHWQMAEIEESLRTGLIQPLMAPAQIINALIVSGKDRVYEWTLILSGFVSLVSLITAVVVTVRGRQAGVTGSLSAVKSES